MDLCYYYVLPYRLQCLVTSVAAKMKNRKKYGKTYHDIFQFLTTHNVTEQQSEAALELNDFLRYIAEASSVYRSYFSGDLKVEDFPVIDKSFVVANHLNLQCGKPFVIGKTSGTSGQPLKIPYSRYVYQKEYAFWWYHRSFGGVKQGDRIATIAGHKIVDARRVSPPFWVYNEEDKQMFFSSYHLSEPNMKYYVEQLNSFHPEFIHGYPSSIFFIARYINESGYTLKFRPKMITTSSETLNDFQREVIEKAFACKVYILYGNAEFCGHITECPQGRLHVQPFHSLVRILKDDNIDAAPGEVGRIVATNFSNYTFPLVNYDLKDLVKVSTNQTCSCAKGGLIVDYIIGRVEDYIVTPDGRYVGRLSQLFKDVRYVKNGQIIQDEPRSITIRVERSDHYSQAVEKDILREARQRLGEKIEITFDYENPILKEANGKFRYIVQNQKLTISGSSKVS